ncbi:hypothetical protein FRB90_005248 [Tulasnella sp. 427]|nr:hypothetical protein FRB90_005248 [Tulasnella sp. 427]
MADISMADRSIKINNLTEHPIIPANPNFSHFEKGSTARWPGKVVWPGSYGVWQLNTDGRDGCAGGYAWILCIQQTKAEVSFSTGFVFPAQWPEHQPTKAGVTTGSDPAKGHEAATEKGNTINTGSYKDITGKEIKFTITARIDEEANYMPTFDITQIPPPPKPKA